MKKIFLLFCFFSFLLGNVHAQNIKPGATDSTGPQLVFVSLVDSIYDLGMMPLGSSMDYQLEIKNTGSEPLVISDMKCDSKNIHYKWPTKRVKPGKKDNLMLTYNAHGDNGSFENYIYIYYNAAASPKILHVVGAIIPEKGTYSPSSKPSSKGGGRHGH